MSAKTLSTIGVILIVLAFVAGAVVLTLYFTVGSGPSPQPGPVGFTVTLNDETFSEDASGLTIDKENTVTVSGADEYAVSIGAAMPSEDFELTVGAEVWKWSELTERDFTGAFDISLSDGSFTLAYPGLADVVGYVFGVSPDGVAYAAVPEGDLFAMTISADSGFVVLRFRPNDLTLDEPDPDPVPDPDVPVEDLELDKDGIVF